jgi:hypothetical protein
MRLRGLTRKAHLVSAQSAATIWAATSHLPSVRVGSLPSSVSSSTPPVRHPSYPPAQRSVRENQSRASGGASARARGMPTLNLSTNVPVDAVVAADILKDCSRVLARVIGKPESVRDAPVPFDAMPLSPPPAPRSFGIRACVLRLGHSNLR